jgi:manganese transport protein
MGEGDVSDAAVRIGAGAEAGLSGRTQAALREAVAGRRRGLRALLPAAGPAVVASIAYMDPGNYATNIQAGAQYGYALLWVVLAANLLAMLFQSLAAKLGLATGHNLAELARLHFSGRVVIAMWAVSELAAMATDLAELIGAAIGLSLLFHVPLLAAMVIAGAATWAMLGLERYGFRPMEIAIACLVGVIGASYLAELVIAPPDWGAVVRHSVLPTLPDQGAVLLACGIVGATVMPHAIFLHSGLTQARVSVGSAAERRRLLTLSNREVVLALGLAGLINMAMVAMAVRAFHATGHADIAEIGTAYHTLVPVLGGAAAAIFLLSLLASGLSSSVVGTMAGQMIMQGFLGRGIPLWLRRLATMLPALVIVGVGANPTRALVLSQVALSFALPVPVIALLVLTARPALMGELVNARFTTVAAAAAAALVLVLNIVLLAQMAGLF